MEKISIACECNGVDCGLRIELPIETLDSIKTTHPDSVIIVNGCPTGPEPEDTLISNESGYDIYRNGMNI